MTARVRPSEALILAGGFGKRLRPLTDTVPKPLVPEAGKPIVVRQIEWLRAVGVRRFVLCISYLKDKIVGELGNGSKLGVDLEYVVESEPLGTGGAMKNAEASLSKKAPFFAVNGDVLTDIDPSRVSEALDGDPLLVGALALVPLPSPYGIVHFDKDERILHFREKPLIRDYWINAGVYCLRPSVFDFLPLKGSIEHDTFPKLASRLQLVAVRNPECYWQSIDGLKDLETANEHFAALAKK